MNRNGDDASPKRVACLITNEFVLLPSIPQGSDWASGDGVPIENHSPPGGNTLGTLVFLCFLVLWALWALGALLVRWEWKYLIDFLLGSALVTILTYAWVFHPSGIIKQPV